MNCNSKISIIIPSFNQGKYIEQTIRSVLEQDYPNTELIIIDGGSTDETTDVINKYGKQIKYWVSEKDNGQAHAINKGLAVASGDIFNWINSDDYLVPGALKEAGQFFSENIETDILCGYTRCFYDDDNATSHEYRMGVKQTAERTITEVEMNQPGTFYRTNVVRSFGGVNESLRYVFDDELWFKYLLSSGISRIGFTDKRLAEFRLHRDSKSVGEGFDLFNKEIQSLYIDIAKRLDAPEWLLRRMNNEVHAESYVSTIDIEKMKIDPERFFSPFALKYVNSLFLEGETANAKEAMKMIIANGYFKWNRMMTSLRMKLLFR